MCVREPTQIDAVCEGASDEIEVIASSMLYLQYPLQWEAERYPKEAFAKDLVNEVNQQN